MTGQLHLFGIRHHGPGSAHSLLRALDRLDPAAVMVEGPPEADGVIGFAGSALMEPQLALLVHTRDQPQRSSFFPMARYSPEWIAIRWALARNRPVRFIDLPAAWLRCREWEPSPTRSPPTRCPIWPPSLAMMTARPGGTIWSSRQPRGGPVRRHRGRDDGLARNPARTRRPRGAARSPHAAGPARSPGPHAGPVGAWHVPTLRRTVAAKSDRVVLKGAPRAAMVATWVPWTDTRLATRSGYGAGVVSPGWHRHLWAVLGRHRVGEVLSSPILGGRWRRSRWGAGPRSQPAQERGPPPAPCFALSPSPASCR